RPIGSPGGLGRLSGLRSGSVGGVHAGHRGFAGAGARTLNSMALYMLDTDISSYIMKRSHNMMLRRLQAIPVGDICISSITKSELMYGVEISPRQQQDRIA